MDCIVALITQSGAGSACSGVRSYDFLRAIADAYILIAGVQNTSNSELWSWLQERAWV